MRPSLILLCLIAATALSACETMKGAGRDMSSAGQVVTSEANKAQN